MVLRNIFAIGLWVINFFASIGLINLMYPVTLVFGSIFLGMSTIAILKYIFEGI